MKNSFFFFLSLVLSLSWGTSRQAFAQPDGTTTLQLVVKNERGGAMANTEVKLINTENGHAEIGKTDATGNATFVLKGGSLWQISIKKIRDYWKWRVEVKPGMNYQQRRLITYNYDNYERETRPKVDRRKLQLQTENQNFKYNEKPSKELGIIKVVIQKADKSPLQKYPVALTCYKLGKTFTASTSNDGEAFFKVPIGQEYEVDIDGIESYKYVDLPNNAFGTAWVTFTYEPTVVNETIVNDTVTQKLPGNVHGTSGRALVTIEWREMGGDVWRNEPVYLAEIKGSKVYKATTNENGEAVFLLPIGKKYMMHGKYQQDIDVVNLTLAYGVSEFKKQRLYVPDPRFQYPERYIPGPDRLFLSSFMNFFDQQLPMPQPGESLLTYASFGNEVNAESEQAILKVGLTAESASNDILAYDHRPVNVSFVLDRSGSMAGYERIENLRLGMENFMGRLRDKDYVSITTFDSYATVVVEASTLASSRQDALHEIRRIDAGGSTNILDGLKKGYEEALKNYNPDRANHLVILTDGYGDNPVEEVLALSKEYNAKGISCSTVGVGEGYNAALLDMLASEGKGTTELLDSAYEMLDVFSNVLSTKLFPIAKDIEMEIAYDKHLLFVQMDGFDLREKQNGRLKLKLENMYADASPQLALLKFTLVNPTKEIEAVPVTIRTKFFDIRKNQKVVQEEKAYLKWSPVSGKLEYLTLRNDKKMYAIAIMNRSLKVMADAFAAQDRMLAQKTLEETIKEVKYLFPEAGEQAVEALMADLNQYLFVLSNLK